MRRYASDVSYLLSSFSNPLDLYHRHQRSTLLAEKFYLLKINALAPLLCNFSVCERVFAVTAAVKSAARLPSIVASVSTVARVTAANFAGSQEYAPRERLYGGPRQVPRRQRLEY